MRFKLRDSSGKSQWWIDSLSMADSALKQIALFSATGASGEADIWLLGCHGLCWSYNGRVPP